MDFNMKKLASDAGIFFTRAVQFTEEKFGQAEKTELDAHFENLLARADSTKNWTERILRQTEVPEWKSSCMRSWTERCPQGSPMGSCWLSTWQKQPASWDPTPPMKERRLLQNRRLDLDACKARLKKAKAAEAKATCEGDTVPDFQETRPRNYILSASASALWNDEVDKAEQELRVAQTEFDRQAEVTRLLLEGISSTHVNHLRCLHEFVKSQTTYYAQCYRHMLDLQKQLGSSQGTIFPGTFVGTTEPASPPLSSTSPTTTAATMPVVPTGTGLAPPEEAALCLEEVAPPASGTRKARVLYDYEAADSSELALLADELITVYSLPGMDPDWLIGERGNKKGKVPVTYLELLS
ncbi:endophilin-B2 isoform X8 [Microtus oregoni]|uniref:endophilin-B2 isoform X8 n=1 Tax=Microtus oregoni TaxID=111838 RepID=UPI001BB1D84A|nr:endophilin-B2 isoform X8 [Microtus oregoni]